jgi:hypothetical protein
MVEDFVTETKGSEKTSFLSREAGKKKPNLY